MSTLSFQAHQSNHKQHNMSAGSAAVSGQHYHTGHENPPSTTGHDDGFTTIPPATQLSQDVEVGGVNDIPLNDHVHGRTTHDYAGALLQLSGNSVPSPQPLSQSSKQQTAMSRVEPMSATSATVTAGMEQRGTKRRAVGNSLPDSFISGDWSPGITHAEESTESFHLKMTAAKKEHMTALSSCAREQVEIEVMEAEIESKKSAMKKKREEANERFAQKLNTEFNHFYGLELKRERAAAHTHGIASSTNS